LPIGCPSIITFVFEIIFEIEGVDEFFLISKIFIRDVMVVVMADVVVDT